MSSRNVVLDSDDEGSDLSPVKTTAPRDHPRQPVMPPADDALGSMADAPGGRGTDSTDPSFFQNVYEEQQDVAATERARPKTVGASESRDDSSAPVAGQRGDAAGNSSSLTDPGMSGRRTGKSKVRDFADLTQVTTPGKTSSDPATDMWDVPSSPDPGSAARKGAKADGKRKRGPKASFPSEAVCGATDAALPGDDAHAMPASKRRRSTGRRSSARAADDVHFVEVPQTGEGVEAAGHTADGAESSVVYDTARAVQNTMQESGSGPFYIAPSRLTASQKLEYRAVASSSAPDNDVPTPSLLLGAHVEDMLQRSSGDATIAYPTPSRYCSSIPPLPDPVPDESGTYSSLSSAPKRRSRPAVDDDPASSPDVIAAYSPAAHKPCKPAEPLEESVEGHRDIWDPEADEFSREHYAPRPSRSRRRSGADMAGTQPLTAVGQLEPRTSAEQAQTEQPKNLDGGYAEAILISPGQEVPVDTPKPKKRGRKKKEVQTPGPGTPVPAIDSPAAVPESTPPVKRRRGRPRKPVTQKAADAVVEVDGQAGSADAVAGASAEMEAKEPAPEVTAPEPPRPTPKKRGRKKKAQATAPPPREEPEDVAPMKVLGEIDRNAVSANEAASATASPDAGKIVRTPVKEAMKDVKKEGAKETPKPGNGAGAAGKVPFRVGLSKRSRIAPLLKSLRK